MTADGICALRLSALGDCINAFGVLQAIQKHHAHIPLTWITDRRFAPLFTEDSGHDIIPMIRCDFKGGTLSAFFEISRALKDRHFSTLLNMQTSIKASLCSLKVRADRKIGYDSYRSREMHSCFVNEKIAPAEDPHVISGFLNFAAAAGVPVEKPEWDFKLSERERSKAAELTEGAEKIFALSPCSAKAVKNWTEEGYCSMLEEMQSLGMCTVILGGSSVKEKSVAQSIADKIPSCINLCGKTSLRDLAAVLERTSLLLSPDSGTMHLASALHTPVVGLFAVHDEKRVGPFNYPDLCVSVYRELSEKELNGKVPSWRYRVKDPDAMKYIHADRVKEMLLKALNTYGIKYKH